MNGVVSLSSSQNLIHHAGVAAVGCNDRLDGTVGRCAVRLSSTKVVLHLRIQLIRGLRLGLAGAARLLLGCSAVLARTVRGTVGGTLSTSSRLGLLLCGSFRLTVTLLVG